MNRILARIISLSSNVVASLTSLVCTHPLFTNIFATLNLRSSSMKRMCVSFLYESNDLFRDFPSVVMPDELAGLPSKLFRLFIMILCSGAVPRRNVSLKKV